MRHLTTMVDLSSAEIERIYAISEDLKAKCQQGIREPLFPGRVMALLFEKQSLRTRISFEAGMSHLGGSSIMLGSDVGWKKRESVEDFVRVLSSYVDVIVCRANQHESIEQLVAHASCCVINGLTDLAHPCQALTDLFTLKELRGPLTGRKLAFIGDGNNVARSLAVACGRLGVCFSIASPRGYQLSEEFVRSLRVSMPDVEIVITHDPHEAVEDATAVYTDVWASMGQESQKEQRRRDFAEYQVDARLMAHAGADALFMHCLPAHRGLEVAAEVIDGPQSVVIEQAENRMHVQKGIVAWLLGSQ